MDARPRSACCAHLINGWETNRIGLGRQISLSFSLSDAWGEGRLLTFREWRHFILSIASHYCSRFWAKSSADSHSPETRAIETYSLSRLCPVGSKSVAIHSLSLRSQGLMTFRWNSWVQRASQIHGKQALDRFSFLFPFSFQSGSFRSLRSCLILGTYGSIPFAVFT